MDYDECLPTVNSESCYWLNEREEIILLPYIKVLQSRAMAYPTLKSVRILMHYLGKKQGKHISTVLPAELAEHYHFPKYFEIAQTYITEVLNLEKSLEYYITVSVMYEYCYG